MFLGNVFPPIPSELVMYYIGRAVGEEKLERWTGRHGRWLTLAPEDIEKVDRRFERHGR